MYAFPSGRKVNVKFCDSSSDEEDSKKTSKRKSKKDKKKKKTSARCSTLLYPSGPLPMRYPPGVAPIYVAPQPARPIFAAHIQMNPVVQPVAPCPMIAVTHTQLYPRPAMPSFGPPPSTTYVLQAVNQVPAAVPMAVTASAVPAAGGFYSAGQSPFMYPIYTG